jgi:transketolase
MKRDTKIIIPHLELKSRIIRATCIQMAFDAKIGHLGSALSCVEALVALYYYWLNISPENIKNKDRDRFILSKGHGCSSWYAVLADKGFFPCETLFDYGRADTKLPDHPCRHALDISECSSGSLGYGLGIATGMLYGLRLDGIEPRIAVLMGDGECNEGSVWEAAMFAAAHKMGNLLALIDYNGIQAVGRSDEIMGYTSLEEKFRAFGWEASTINGNNIVEIIQELDKVPFSKNKPSAIILKTKKGAGVDFMEDQVLWHYRVPSNEDLNNALKILQVDPIHIIKK